MPPSTGNPALHDVRVRKAITMAIDRQALLDTVWSGKGELIGSMVVPTDPFYEDLTGVNPYNPDEARRLLAEAGHPQLTLRLRPAALPYASKAAQFVSSQLAAVGITATVDELGFQQPWISTVMGQADYDLSIVAHVEPRDVVTFANPAYYWRYDNPEVNDARRASADAGTVAEEYVADMKQAARILAEDAAAVWLFTCRTWWSPSRASPASPRTRTARWRSTSPRSRAPEDVVLRSVLARLGIFAASLLAASFVIFVITQALPGDVAAVDPGLRGDAGAAGRQAGRARHRPALPRPVRSTGSAACCAATSGAPGSPGLPVATLIAPARSR